MRSKALTIAVAAALLGAAPAQAAKKPDRAGAKALAQAAKELRSGFLVSKPALETALLRLERDPACDQAIRGVPFSKNDTAAFEAATELLVTYKVEALIAPVRTSLANFAEDIAAAKLRDPVLRSGRAAQVQTYRRLVKVGDPPADICPRLDAWRQAGYPADQAPTIEDPGLDAALGAQKKLDRYTKKINRAGKRLRKLGVSKRVVNYWNGEDTALFKGIDTGDADLHIGQPR